MIIHLRFNVWVKNAHETAKKIYMGYYSKNDILKLFEELL